MFNVSQHRKADVKRSFPGVFPSVQNGAHGPGKEDCANSHNRDPLITNVKCYNNVLQNIENISPGYSKHLKKKVISNSPRASHDWPI